MPGQRLDVVVEVDQHRLVETGLDEAVGVTVVGGVERRPARKRCTFSTRTSPSKWVTEPALEIGSEAASPMAKISGATCRLQGVLVGEHEAELVAQTR